MQSSESRLRGLRCTGAERKSVPWSCQRLRICDSIFVNISVTQAGSTSTFHLQGDSGLGSSIHEINICSNHISFRILFHVNYISLQFTI